MTKRERTPRYLMMQITDHSVETWLLTCLPEWTIEMTTVAFCSMLKSGSLFFKATLKSSIFLYNNNYYFMQ